VALGGPVKIIKIIVLTILLVIPTLVIASEGVYTSAHVGANFSGELNKTIHAHQWLSSFRNYNWPDLKSKTEYKQGQSFSGVLGYDFGKIRIESEAAYSENKVKSQSRILVNSILNDSGTEYDVELVSREQSKNNSSGDTKTYSLMMNCYFDIENNTIFTPFIMGGLGVVKVDVNDTKINDNDTALAYQAGVGVTTSLTDRVMLDLKYQYFASDNLKFKKFDEFVWNKVTADLSSQTLSLGIRYYF
jgi:opacity protein-like surface antigen